LQARERVERELSAEPDARPRGRSSTRDEASKFRPW
jgi:hypothetical protein